MRVKILRGFCLGPGRGDVYPGEEADIPDNQAAYYIERGKVEQIIAPPPDSTDEDPKPAAPSARKAAKGETEK